LQAAVGGGEQGRCAFDGDGLGVAADEELNGDVEGLLGEERGVRGKDAEAGGADLEGVVAGGEPRYVEGAGRTGRGIGGKSGGGAADGDGGAGDDGAGGIGDGSADAAVVLRAGGHGCENERHSGVACGDHCALEKGHGTRHAEAAGQGSGYRLIRGRTDLTGTSCKRSAARNGLLITALKVVPLREACQRLLPLFPATKIRQRPFAQ